LAIKFLIIIFSKIFFRTTRDFPKNFSQNRLLKTPQSIIKYLLTYNRYNSLLILAITSLIMIFSLVFFRTTRDFPNNFSQSRLLKAPQSIIKYLLTYIRCNSLLILAITSLIIIFSKIFSRTTRDFPNDY
jgi:hypothetical protein